ncbi:MAG: EAL domain-containing protein [Desulfobacteraceae bacterium]|nr:EAL domain-containing protein [Desulfobacteraceae bacterium]
MSLSDIQKTCPSALNSDNLFIVLNEMSFGVIIIASTEDIIFLNRWISEHCDRIGDYSQVKPLSELFPELENSRIFQAVKNCLRFNMTKKISNKLLGTPFPFYRLGSNSSGKEHIAQQVTINPINLPQHSRCCLVTIFDVSQTLSRENHLKRQSADLQTALKGLKEREEHLRAIFKNTTDGIITFDERGKIEEVNPPCEKIFDVPLQQLIGSPINSMIAEFDENSSIKHIVETLHILKKERTELTGLRNKNQFPIEFSLSFIKELSLRKYVAIVRDISTRKKHEEQLIKLAKFDNLTGLCNRTLFDEKLNDAIKRAYRKKQKFALFFLGLDRFKNINDTLGHSFGDQLILHTSRVLKNTIRQTDIIARFEGDEFTIILEEINHLEIAGRVAQKIIDCFSHNINLNGRTVAITTSIGIAIYPQDGHDTQTLLKNANSAMHTAKVDGRNCYAYFSPEMNIKAQKRVELETDLRHAISRNEFILYFQPQISLRENRPVGTEALIRWNHSKRGLVPPFDFIPIAEDSSLIIPIGNWVIEKSILHLAELIKIGFHDIEMGINVSPKQFKSESLIQVIQSSIVNANVNPHQVVIEITEGHLMGDSKNSFGIMTELENIGVQIALDDFGTGYSSLSYLRQMPIDHLKIDRSFIKDIDQNTSALKIFDAIIKLAQLLEIKVIAEGVETEKQLSLVKEKCCDIIQGYYYSKPLPFQELCEYLKNFR